jgi:hypothetical protein
MLVNVSPTAHPHIILIVCQYQMFPSDQRYASPAYFVRGIILLSRPFFLSRTKKIKVDINRKVKRN